MQKIKLARDEWEYDPSSQLGKAGGCGEVFRGTGEGSQDVAIKRLKLGVTDSAMRELEMAEELIGSNLGHVIPIFDAGRDANSGQYFIVMAVAEKSLQDEIIDRAGNFSEIEAVIILREIAEGLSEAQKIVHRDLKPLNVLKHEGAWKIADFGISRFIDEATSAHTLKESKTPPYAAPEQWDSEHATNATDIYALGCISYTLINGNPPFDGPSIADWKQQHTKKSPPKLKTSNPLLEVLVGQMMDKVAGSRPDIKRILEVLNNVASERQIPAKELEGGLAEIARVGAIVLGEQMNKKVAEIAEHSERAQRELLKINAVKTLEQEIIQPLFDKIEDIANARRIFKNTLQLGSAKMEFKPPVHSQAIVKDALKYCGWDLIAMAEISIVQESSMPYIWSASLFYTDKGEDSGYRWYELQFMTHPLMRSRRAYEPFASTDTNLIDIALSPTMGSMQLAAKPKPIDVEDFLSFQDRWSSLFAKGAQGQITHPRELPLKS